MGSVNIRVLFSENGAFWGIGASRRRLCPARGREEQKKRFLVIKGESSPRGQAHALRLREGGKKNYFFDQKGTRRGRAEKNVGGFKRRERSPIYISKKAGGC